MGEACGLAIRRLIDDLPDTSMRILYASERPPYPFFLGGAARCAHRLLFSMVQDPGVECAALGSADYAVSPWVYPQPAEYGALGVRGVSLSSPAPGMHEEHGHGTVDCGYPVHVMPDYFNALGSFINTFKPDVVWAQMEGAREVLVLAHSKGVQGLLYVHDAEFDPVELRATADLGCHVVCSSGFLARLVRKVIGRPAHVVYPASDWYFGTQGDPRGCVTMINPHKVKGIDTFLEIARRLPEEKFLLVESWKLGDVALAALQAQQAQLPNVRFQHRVSDMREVYAQTRLLLVPSVWEEGFGMVAVEAQSCGIPVIASARGGLPESVGDGGMLIRDHRNVDAWMEAISQVLGDEAAYRTWAGRALRHAQSADFVPQELARRFLAVCTAPAPRTGAYARGMRMVRNQLERVPVLGRMLQKTGR